MNFYISESINPILSHFITLFRCSSELILANFDFPKAAIMGLVLFIFLRIIFKKSKLLTYAKNSFYKHFYRESYINQMIDQNKKYEGLHVETTKCILLEDVFVNNIGDILNLVNDVTNKNKIINIIGIHGSGKTTILRYLALTKSQNNSIVFYIDLSKYQENIFLGEPLSFLLFEDTKKSLNVPLGWFISAMQENCLILVDGLDGIISYPDQEKIFNWLNVQKSNYQNCNFVLAITPEFEPQLKGNEYNFIVNNFSLDQTKRLFENISSLYYPNEGDIMDFDKIVKQKDWLLSFLCYPYAFVCFMNYFLCNGSIPPVRKFVDKIYHYLIDDFTKYFNSTEQMHQEIVNLAFQDLNSPEKMQHSYFNNKVVQTFEDVQNFFSKKIFLYIKDHIFRFNLIRNLLISYYIQQNPESLNFLIEKTKTIEEDWKQIAILFFSNVDLSKGEFFELLISKLEKISSDEDGIAQLNWIVDTICEIEFLPVNLTQKFKQRFSEIFSHNNLFEQNESIGKLTNRGLVALKYHEISYENYLPQDQFILEREFRLFLEETNGCLFLDHDLSESGIPLSNKPILGIRSSDALNYCKWLTYNLGNNYYIYRTFNDDEANKMINQTIYGDSSECIFWIIPNEENKYLNKKFFYKKFFYLWRENDNHKYSKSNSLEEIMKFYISLDNNYELHEQVLQHYYNNYQYKEPEFLDLSFSLNRSLDQKINAQTSKIAKDDNFQKMNFELEKIFNKYFYIKNEKMWNVEKKDNTIFLSIKEQKEPFAIEMYEFARALSIIIGQKGFKKPLLRSNENFRKKWRKNLLQFINELDILLNLKNSLDMHIKILSEVRSDYIDLYITLVIWEGRLQQKLIPKEGLLVCREKIENQKPFVFNSSSFVG